MRTHTHTLKKIVDLLVWLESEKLFFFLESSLLLPVCVCVCTWIILCGGHLGKKSCSLFLPTHYLSHTHKLTHAHTPLAWIQRDNYREEVLALNAIWLHCIFLYWKSSGLLSVCLCVNACMCYHDNNRATVWRMICSILKQKDTNCHCHVDNLHAASYASWYSLQKAFKTNDILK